ncbi:SusC/RagA family TonB-linked outer membrane protein [Arenibacter certesii]|uniref:SusC/RagA family TonB-linked outer membrane protein n=1 Tax=Arenibacter certesii TaxID=228955 RepID=A0A918IWJ7_9FLAO|nr:SusC/RagA family TonB-linked outer membrane protein [Arenibacter certesii]GGW36279.1 SusC/RagA family TonB-linked outer membrane protein [Arenibacter certesii]
MIKELVMYALIFFSCLSLSAQQKKVSGFVYDSQGQEMVGASVIETGTINGVMTDFDGKFTITVNSKATLEITYVGYEKQSISVANKSYFEITLQENLELLDEVVVTAYGGTQLRSKLTSSISKVDDKVYLYGAYSNPAKALAGTVSGLEVVTASGSPTSSPQIILRGGTNFNGTGSPLYIVDGTLRENMHGINPEDIESIEVMKDAGSTAIYGARANNGVVLITTKTGAKGKATINVKSKLSINTHNNPYNFMNARDYLHYFRKAVHNAGNSYLDPNGNPRGWLNDKDLAGATPFGTGNAYFDANGNPLNGNEHTTAVWSTMKYTPELAFLLDQGWQTMTDPIYGDKLIFYDFDMKSVNIKSPSYTQDYALNISGGNDKGSYYSSLGFNNDDGQAPGNYYKRLNFTFNGDYKIKEWLKSISSFKFADESWNGLPATQTNESNYFGRVLGAPPTMRGYNDAGDPILGMNSGDGNQKFQIEKFHRDNKRNQFDINQTLEFDIIDGLKAKASANLYFFDTFAESFNKDFLTRPGNINSARNTSNSYGRRLSKTYTGLITYKRQIKDHFINAMAGTEYFSKRQYGFSASGSGAPTDDFQDLGYTSSEEGKRSIDSYHNEERILSFFGRANYDYQSKYLLSTVLRKDGYSKLIGSNRWGVFPGVSAGWVFSKEDFMESVNDIISFAKVRTSYGVNGNVSDIGLYELQGSYGTNKYDGNIGYSLGALPNPYLVWEKSHTFEVGLDLSFLSNRINSNFSYYNRRTQDKFTNISLPASSGMNSLRTNNGEIQNLGLEFDLGFKVIQNADISWNININGAFAQNKVTKLPDNENQNNRQGGQQIWDPENTTELLWVGGYQEGQRPGDMYAFNFQGVYQNYDEIPGDLIDEIGGKKLYGPDAWEALSDIEKRNGWPIQPGDAIWQDVNGDGIIDRYDLVYQGNRNPDLSGGISSALSWKGLTFTARMNYAIGHTLFNEREKWIIAGGQGTFNTLNKMKDAWTSENQSNTLPVMTRADNLGKNNYFRNSSMFYKNGTYLGFKELALSYQLPEVILSKINVQDITLSVSGQNLGYLTSAKGIHTPEMYKSNSNGGYPLPISVIFGASITF